MSKPSGTAKEWSASIANFAVDALLDAGFVQREHFDDAAAVVADEIFIWLCTNNYPPPVDYDALNHELTEQPKAE